jgi:hypothetical protein
MRAVSLCCAEGWLLVCCCYKCNQKLCGSRQLVDSVNNSSPRKCDQCERHPSFFASLSKASSHGQQWPADGVLGRPMAPREGMRLRNAADRSKIPSMSHLVCRRARQKRPSVHRQSRCTRPASSARPLQGQRLQRLSQETRLTSDRRAPHLRAAASDRGAPPSSTRDERNPALISQRSGPRQRPSGGDPRDPFRRKRGTRINKNE